MRYAEVNPEKIQIGAANALIAPLLPDLSLGYDLGSNENVDLDRGGTGDADQFILGPEERDRQWSVNVGWDVGELIWNPDQTSIDTRSKLMVELRDDLLNQLNHLFYARAAYRSKR